MKGLNKTVRELLFVLTPRYLLGLTLIAASFISAFLISSASDRTITVWASTSDLAPGKIIEPTDIAPMRVRLLDNADKYLMSTIPIIGSAITRSIGVSELIPAFAISPTVDRSLQRVPIQIGPNMAPIGASGGDIVDLYGIPNQLSNQAGLPSELILESVAIEKMDISSKEIGGAIGITLLVPENLVPDLISAMGNFNFLIVERT
jgi:hypothetical protein